MRLHTAAPLVKRMKGLDYEVAWLTVSPASSGKVQILVMASRAEFGGIVHMPGRVG